MRYKQKISDHIESLEMTNSKIIDLLEDFGINGNPSLVSEALRLARLNEKYRENIDNLVDLEEED
tara:strand:+ start:585 stop:779 length:195 start_codon:yes stop_codon:yes gene_type:complete